MPSRTVKVQGWGTGTASLTATLDGETVFSGDVDLEEFTDNNSACLLYTSPSPRDRQKSRMPSSA